MIHARRNVHASMRRIAWTFVAALALPPAAAPAADPGDACVEPHLDILGRVGADARDRLDFALVPDLDGDRRRDLLLWDGGTCGSGGCTVHVYLTNRGCARWGGWIRGVAPVALRSRHGGVRDLRTHENGGALSWTESIAEHDGHEYRVRERDCTQPVEPGPPRCSDFRPRAP